MTHPADRPFQASTSTGRRRSWSQWASTATRLVILVSAVGAIVLTTAIAAPPVGPTVEATRDPAVMVVDVDGSGQRVLRLRALNRPVAKPVAVKQKMSFGDRPMIQRAPLII